MVHIEVFASLLILPRPFKGPEIAQLRLYQILTIIIKFLHKYPLSTSEKNCNNSATFSFELCIVDICLSCYLNYRIFYDAKYPFYEIIYFIGS